MPPAGSWDTWAIIAGRGAGKTFAGASWVLDMIAAGSKRIALVGATSADVRDIMVEGPSGIETLARQRNMIVTPQLSRRRVNFPGHHAAVYLYSAEEPDRLRGPQHDASWCDELAAWKYVDDTWDNLMYGMREGDNPQTMVTTTPRPISRVRKLIAEATEPDSRTVVTRASLYDNAENLPESFVAAVTKAYGGTRKGRQEIEGELLEDVEGALWNLATIDKHRMIDIPDGVSLVTVVVAVDPATTSGEDSNETGIIVAAAGSDKRGYILADLSLRGQPLEWARRAVGGYDVHEADTIVVETNQGGEMIRTTLRTVKPGIPVKEVHASRGKATRAEPISALYEQGLISHVGRFDTLEDQQCNWVPGMPSPDRMDAAVWALTALYNLIGEQSTGGFG
jgi:phage terminase large subunit-like protein